MNAYLKKTEWYNKNNRENIFVLIAGIICRK